MGKFFPAFFEQRINELQKMGCYGTALNYRKAKSSLESFLNGKDLNFGKPNIKFVEQYSYWLQNKGMIKNSISFHMLILRAVYNKGTKIKNLKQTYPFQTVYTGVDKTIKRSTEEKVLSRLIKLNLNEFPNLEEARDYFLFSLYARGIAFVDTAHLQKSNIIDDEIVYIRRKTGQSLRIYLEEPLLLIIEKRRSKFPCSPYLFDT